LAHTVQDDETSPVDRGRMRHMLPVANKPILFHALESMATAGIENVAIAVTADAEERIAEAVGSGEAWEVPARRSLGPPAGRSHGR
jgi:glucose-1-phosphate thymidylyltransferase